MNYQDLRSYAMNNGADWARKMKTEIDNENQAILAQRQKFLDSRKDIGVGDFVILADDDVRRVTHDWGDAVQTTCGKGHPCYSDTSFYLGQDYVSFSGSLDPAIDKTRFEFTGETREGGCWFFSQNHAEAHNGWHTKAQWKVWRLIPATK